MHHPSLFTMFNLPFLSQNYEFEYNICKFQIIILYEMAHSINKCVIHVKITVQFCNAKNDIKM